MFSQKRRCRHSLSWRGALHLLIALALVVGAFSLQARPAHAGLLQTLSDFFSLGANTVRELQKAIQVAGSEVRATLQALNDQITDLLQKLSDTFQDNLNVTLNSLDAATRNKLLELEALFTRINQQIQEDITLAGQTAKDVINEASLKVRQAATELTESLKSVIILGGETVAFVVDRVVYDAILVIALILLGVGLLLFVILLFTGRLPQQGLARTLILIFMAVFLVIFGSLAFVPPVRAFVMTNAGVGLKQKLEKDQLANQPHILTLVPERVILGETTELQVWGVSLLPGGAEPTATVANVAAPVQASANDRIALNVAGLPPGTPLGSANVVLTYSGGITVRGVVTLAQRVTPPPPSDLVLTAFTLNPASPREDDNVQASITVRNVGGPAGAFFVQWRPRAADIATGPRQRVAGMAAGETRQITFNTVYNSAGTFQSVALVDVDGQVAESNEANNSRTVNVTVRAMPTRTPVPPSNKFVVRVTTGDRTFAGTDANVFITLFGDGGDSGEIKLDTPGRDDFERGQTDTFSLVLTRNIGNIVRIRIRHDNSGIASGWFLDQITVTNQDTNVRRTFNANRWLATDEGDGRIDIFLTPN